MAGGAAGLEDDQLLRINISRHKGRNVAAQILPGSTGQGIKAEVPGVVPIARYLPPAMVEKAGQPLGVGLLQQLFVDLQL